MANFVFQKASKSQARLRLGLAGPSGSGKTYSALAIATALAGENRVAVIDTEHGTASKYAGIFSFDACELTDCGPLRYVEAIEAAAAHVGRGGVVIVDSLSHAWMGAGGALEQVDKAAKRSAGNSFAAWRDVTPQHNRMLDALQACDAHLIATLRSKTEYVLEENERGKKVPKKIGTAPIQRDGMEYEFDVFGDLTLDNDLCVSKTRCPALAGAVIRHPGEQIAKQLRAWLEEGVPLPPAPPALLPLPDVPPIDLEEAVEAIADAQQNDDLGALRRLADRIRVGVSVGTIDEMQRQLLIMSHNAARGDILRRKAEAEARGVA